MRRAFLEMRELPQLMAGAWRGEPSALRRLIGARFSGRIGVLLALTAALCAVPVAGYPRVALFWAVMAAGLRFLVPRFSWREQQRVELWLAAPLLLLAVPFRAIDGLGVFPAAIAILIAHRMTWSRLESL